ncbi:UDP-N-acetylmuramoylalanine--D-glutamate ligase [Ferrigenium kumadai]|uniref:UDP-N-acetylmuramoylalanine--D-glutamate ligase n=1 Tax=Ferrigenium kumadai TaxID=1682490 RepID=A0AAN1T122_9PROT|nr:UDP-N-acetylmuramoyl-L-alanine--D-glutamate ligase [Ferrigenium kumadai]BBJ00478.1 UDP-N-acetylmuramoylalanine--D-glutamate ligase [Ferrigenium kumadai]
MTQFKDKSVLVLGLGETGLSLARWLSAQGARVRVADSRANPPGLDVLQRDCPKAEMRCGAFDDSLLQGVDRIAISPGVPMAEPFVQRAIARGITVEGDIELLAQQLATGKLGKVIAITGANGKTTVTSMVEHLCKAAGKDVVAAGNISPAVLDVVMQRGEKQPEVWVLELSSFQLETTFTLNADAATVLNISEDHLDRYAGMDEYAAAKARIFQGDGEQVLNRDDARSMGMALPGRRIVTFGLDAPRNGSDWGIAQDGADIWLVQGDERLLRASELQVTGLHNVANALAALALCRAIDLPMPALLAALRSFKGLPHRVERVAEIDGVTYYDDSKGTNVGATEAALKGLGRKAVVILGGEGKGQDFSPLNPAVAQHARAAVLIGRDAPLIEAALQGCGVQLLRAKDMDDAVRQASRLAQHGDAVLLSPACASFDMFRNYAHRAEVFIAAVRDLQKEAA